MATNAFSPGFQALYGSGYNDLLAACSRSSEVQLLFIDLLAKGGSVNVGVAGKGTSSDGTNITIDPNLLVGGSAALSDTQLVVVLAHELGHVVDGGSQSFTSADTSAQASSIGLNNEGIALKDEYIAQEQLGNVGMYSGGPNGAIQTQLAQLAQKDGGTGTTQFATDAINAGASWTANQTPSNAPNLTYSQYYADQWAVSQAGCNAGTVDFTKVNPGTLTITTNANGTCTVNTVQPLSILSSSETEAISGTISTTTGKAVSTTDTTYSGSTVVGTVTETGGTSAPESVSISGVGTQAYANNANVSEAAGSTVTLAGDNNVVSEPGSKPGAVTTLTLDGYKNHVNDYEYAVGKTGGPDGGTVNLGADTFGNVVDAVNGGAKVNVGTYADGIVEGGIGNGIGGELVTLGNDDNVLLDCYSVVQSAGTANEIDVGASVYTDIYGSYETIAGNGSDSIYVSGTSDHVYDDSSTIDFTGTNTGDIVYGKGDSGYGWAGYVSEVGTYGGYTGYYYSSTARTKGTRSASGSAKAAALHTALKSSGAGIETLAAHDAILGKNLAGIYRRNGGRAASPLPLETATTHSRVLPVLGLASHASAQSLIHAMATWPLDGPGAITTSLAADRLSGMEHVLATPHASTPHARASL
jgi:hypothetical protein